MNPQLELLASQLKSCMDQTLHIASGVPESARCTQLKPGKAHPLWLIGHLANTINLLLLHWTLQVEGVVPKEYRKKFAPDFGGGDPVTPDPADYPAWDEVV
ncbi:MAG TPA: DinB family protein, partial [Candidatus Hydrogenedentes bacterium]|nr:DinB family protein [Candidatus Hydrogenedentota bacterium]